MALTKIRPSGEGKASPTDVGSPVLQFPQDAGSGISTVNPRLDQYLPAMKPSQSDALQVLLSFAALHEQMNRKKALATAHKIGLPVAEFKQQFVLEEVLQLVAERAMATTGADGLAIGLGEKDEIVLRAVAGKVRPDIGARIGRDSSFSVSCIRTLQIVRCDDTEADARVNLQACRRLGARSMVAVPLCGRERGIGLLEAFSAEPFGLNDSDVQKFSLLAELVVGALKPEDEDRFAESAQAAATKLEASAFAPEWMPTWIELRKLAPVHPAHAALADTKPLEREVVASLPAAEILYETALELEGASSKFRPSVAAQRAAAPEVIGEKSDRATLRSGILVLLACIVIAAAFALGVWWRLKTTAFESVKFRTEKIAPKRARAAATDLTASPSPLAGSAANPRHSDQDAIPNSRREGKSSARPQATSSLPWVTGIQHSSSPDSSTVILNLEDQVQYEAHRLSSPDRIYFDLYNTQLSSDLAGKSIEVRDGLLKRIRAAQPVAGMTRIVLETKAKANYSVRLEPNPHRLVVEVRKSEPNPVGKSRF
jgi:hypothetical protein